MILNFSILADDNYFEHLEVVLLSLLENSSNETDDINIYVLDNGLKQHNKSSIAKRFGLKKNFRITFCDITAINSLVNPIYDNGWTKSTYGWFLLPVVTNSDVKKIIHLDSDVVISKSISELFELDLGESCIAGVLDFVGSRYKKKLGLGDSDIYINSGVLLIDLVKLRKDKIFTELISTANNQNIHFQNADQDVLNIVFKGKIKVLPLEYNVQTILFEFENNIKNIIKGQKILFYGEKEIYRAIQNPVIVHFSGRIKPWMDNCNHPLKNKYLQYRGDKPQSRQCISRNILETAKKILFKWSHWSTIRMAYIVKNLFKQGVKNR